MPSIELKSFHIKNYKGIIDTKVENIPSGTQWIFLTGENGFGKTSVLQALVAHAHGIHGLKEGFVKLVDNTRVGVLHSNEAKRGDDLQLETFVVPLIIGYGSTRLRVSAGTSADVMKEYTSISSLFSNEILLINVEENFKDWHINYPKGYNQLQTIFKALLPSIKEIKVEFDEKDKKNKVKYYLVDEEDKLFEAGIEFFDLAAGYKSIIAMIGDMINRLDTAIRRGPDKSVKTFNDLPGIVLIDEFELHLHPKYQKLFVEKLAELFPKIQFIVSTHSPIPLLGAPANSVIINVTRTKEEGIQAKLLDIDFSVLTPNTILSSPIFGFQDLIPDSKSNDKMIRTEDTFAELKFNDQLKKDINTFLTKEKQEELLRIIKAS